MRTHPVRHHRNAGHLSLAVDTKCDIASGQHVWICAPSEIAEVVYGAVLVPQNRVRSDSEWWNDGVGAGDGATYRLPVVVHPERHAHGIVCRERQLADSYGVRIPDHRFELEYLRAGTIDRRGSGAAWIDYVSFCDAGNLPAPVRRPNCAVVSAERRELRYAAVMPCEWSALESREVSAEILVVGISLQDLRLPGN